MKCNLQLTSHPLNPTAAIIEFQKVNKLSVGMILASLFSALKLFPDDCRLYSTEILHVY